MANKHWCSDCRFIMHDKDGNKYKLLVNRDDRFIDPRDEYNVATMVCWHRRYGLGDKHNYEDMQEAYEDLVDKVEHSWLAERQAKLDEDLSAVWNDDSDYANKSVQENRLQRAFMTDLKAVLDKHYCIKQLYLYDHSGITISTNSFGDSWDSGCVGFVYISKATALEEFGGITEDNWRERANECIDNEVKEYDHYLRGNVWGFILQRKTTQTTCCPHCNEVISTFTIWEHVDSCSGFFGDTLEDCGILEFIPADLTFDE